MVGSTATRMAIERVFREEYGLVLSALTRQLRDLELAEDVLQDALAVALETWPERGVPANPAAWITTTARRKAIDRIRRRDNLARKAAQLEPLLEQAGEPDLPYLDEPIPDERLRLIFTCCHPDLPPDSRVALTLKTLGGLTAAEVAHAFLVSEPAMYQRIVRAKRRIREAGIPYEVPSTADLPERLGSVLAVIYLIFNEGYLGTDTDELVRPDLSAEAIRLGRILAGLMPDEPEVLGLLALMVLHDARRPARTSDDGSLVPLEAQDRSQWDHTLAAEGRALVARALRMGRPGPYQVQAAIAAVHHQAGSAAETDWLQIAALYGELYRHAPNPVVALNHAAAVAMWRGPEAGLALMERLGETLDGYHLFHSARADLLRRLGRREAAGEAYLRALDLVSNQAERRYLERRLAELG